jgi:hypothetical protein
LNAAAFQAATSQYPFSAEETFQSSPAFALHPPTSGKRMTELNQMDDQPPSTGGIPA